MVSSAPLKHFRILYSAIFIAAVIPREYDDFSEEFRASNGSAVGANSFYYQTFETCSFRNKYFYNGFVKDSLFRDVSFRNMYFHYARFENVTFENVRFEWTEDWYMRAEFVNCRFINTMFVGANFKHSSFHRCRFEGGMKYDCSDTRMTRHQGNLHTFVDFQMHDTVFSHVQWFDTLWYRGEAYNVTFAYNRWTRFEMFETKFHSYYHTRVPCKGVTFGDFVYHWEYINESYCYAEVYHYGIDSNFEFDEKFYLGEENDAWHPSVRFYNCRFEYFQFRRTQMRAVEWFTTDFYNGTFHGESCGYFHDQHFAKCQFSYTEFYNFYFRGFAYFTACYFERFKFSEMTGDRMYFYGSQYSNVHMHFDNSYYIYFDYGHWKHGSIKGSYTFLRFENMVHRSFRWEVDRVNKFEYCHLYYDNFTIVTTNVNMFSNLCSTAGHYQKKELQRQFCYGHPYYHQCMHYKPYFRHYYSHDEKFTCDVKTFTWWWHWGLSYPRDYVQSYYSRPYFPQSHDRYHAWSYNEINYPSHDDRFYVGNCYDRMYEVNDQPSMVMREVDFQCHGEFVDMKPSYHFYYDGVYTSEYYWDYYWKVGGAFDRKYYWFDSFFRCFQ